MRSSIVGISRTAGAALAAVSAVVLAACSQSQAQLYSGTVVARSAAVGSTIGGRVVDLPVQSGQRVAAGDVIAKFDDAQQRAQLAAALQQAAAARAALADLRAGTRAPDLARAQALAEQQRMVYESAAQSQSRQVDVLRADVRQAQAQVTSAQASAYQTHADAMRTRKLFTTGDVSAQAKDAANAREAQASAQLRSARAALSASQLNLLNAQRVTLPKESANALAAYRAAQAQTESLALGARPDAIVQARHTYDAAIADVQNARAKLAEQTVRAPAAGVVSSMNLYVGDLVAAGASVATIDEDGEPYVRIFVPQPALARVRVGERVEVRSDADRSKTFAGTIEQIDSQAQFTPQSVQTAEDRATLSFGVKVRIHNNRQGFPGGTTAVVTLK